MYWGSSLILRCRKSFDITTNVNEVKGMVQLDVSDNTTLFGQRNGMVTCIDEVESGLACGCSCIACGGQLVAKKGEVYKHHFAHHSQAKGSCNESIVHKVSKDIILKHKKVGLPSVSLKHIEEDVYGEKIMEVFEQPRSTISLSSVELEKFNGTYTPDVLCQSESGECFGVEIVVTNDVSEEKLEKIKSLRHDVLRIYMSDYSCMHSYETLAQAVLYDAPRDWVFSEKHVQISEELKQKVHARVEKRNKRIMEKEDKRVDAKVIEELSERLRVTQLSSSQIDLIETLIKETLGKEARKLEEVVKQHKRQIKLYTNGVLEELKELKELKPRFVGKALRNGDVSRNYWCKRIVKEYKKVLVPSHCTNCAEIGVDSQKRNVQCQRFTMAFESVLDEQFNDYYEPDLACITSDGQYIEIEFVNNNGLPEEKKKIIEKRKMDVLWINMGDYSPIDSEEMFINAVLYEAPRGWV